MVKRKWLAKLVKLQVSERKKNVFLHEGASLLMAERVGRQQQFFWEHEKTAPKKTFIVPCSEHPRSLYCIQSVFPQAAAQRSGGAWTRGLLTGGSFLQEQERQTHAEIGVSMIFPTGASISPVFSPPPLNMGICRVNLELSFMR